MEHRKVTAIVHVNSLEAVEAALKHAGAVEVAITRVKGYGDYKNFYSAAWVSEQARVEAFVSREQAASVVEAICRAAYAGLDTDGMVAVLPVETLVRIRDHKPGAGP
jgi:nitrogen regulatory protein P-II 1